MTNSGEIQTSEFATPQSYSLIHVENPGNNITQVAFNGNNYDEWSRSFHLALLAKGKDGYIDGTVSKPADSAANYPTWRSTNALVTAWIFNSIEPSLRRTISYRPEAKLVWVDIKNRFCQGNDPRIYRLQADLIACRQGPTESLMSYYGQLTKLWDDILEYDPLPPCSCNPCHCDWVTIMDSRRDKKRVRDFLMGLDTRFDNIRSQILGINPLPNLNLIYNRILQDEGVRNLTHNKTENNPDVITFATRTYNNSRQSGGGCDSRVSRGSNTSFSNDHTRPFCIACKRTGHTYKVCHRVTGNFPEWWGDRPRD
ncbi:uncharacterized protein LOC141651052 [Silene latifolia]|uniref:uncharacterized protein LOC141651052 n=1 Tax=Silene latifolia TaxID=37657 RepID=UPI003D7847FF